MRLLCISALFACLCWAPAGWLAAQATPKRAVNDPKNCPWCKGEPEALAKAGLSSHGGFEFARMDTRAIDAHTGSADILWIETRHLELGLVLRPLKVTPEMRKTIEPELERLRAVLPTVDPKTSLLDSWLRLHLYAQRCEELYASMLEVLGVSSSDFPEGKGDTVWDRQSKFMGYGPHLGQAGKYEVLVLPSQALYEDYMSWQYGLKTTETQRFNVPERQSMTLTIAADLPELREDNALHGHIAFNLAHNFLDGYKHYSYDTPTWIHEGLAHWFERRVDPRFNSFDGAEGSVGNRTSKWRWEPEVVSLIRKGEAPRMAELLRIVDFGDLELRHHFTTWSMVKFLIETNPAGFACLNDRLHGRMNAEGYPDGSNLMDVQRVAFEECLGLGFAEFDAAWSAWALLQISSPPGAGR